MNCDEIIEPDRPDAPAVIATCGCYDGARFVWEPADDGIASHLCPTVRAIQDAIGVHDD